MRKSQNGWPVVVKAQCDLAPLIRDVVVPNGVLAGPVAVVFRWLAREYDRRVERLIKGTCWGWYDKNIEGSTTISNHASATAIDLNADQNPMGVPTRKVLTEDQIAECHKLEVESDNVLRWGGDYVTRPDAMHWEIVGTPAAVRRLAIRITTGANMPMAGLRPMDIGMPMLRQGDDDAKLGGYDTITRMQRILLIEADGIWGPKTTAAIAAWCRIPVADADELSDLVSRRVFGLAPAPAPEPAHA